ncbi:hypothetical protein B0I37DRAFT_378378 [Chaetomium sp. MPI-CAGE-AT-0009]|nr:hypothetical protein B0I37DRAFT_378378 [Chaetomium sp. MPI-CAGE-AT-0009]
MAGPPASLAKKFEDVIREIEDQDIDQCKATIDRHITDPEERKAFDNYISTRERPPPFTTAEEFVQAVDSTDFSNLKACSRLLDGMRVKYPIVVPMGFDGDILYQLATDAFILGAHPQEDTMAAPSSDPLLRTCFLGVNLTVQPPEPSGPMSRRHYGLNKISTRPAKGDHTDSPGFVFFQLGQLQYANPKNGRKGPWDWQDTDFVVVARLGASGRVDGIYAIYNMLEYDDQEDSLEGRDEDVIVCIRHPNWGIPPTAKLTGRKDQFSCAKLGPRLSSFGKDRRIFWTEKIEHPVELVRAKYVKQSKDTGRLLRTTVDGDPPHLELSRSLEAYCNLPPLPPSKDKKSS